MFLRAVSLLSALVAVASQTTSPNFAEGPIGLAQYVKATLQSFRPVTSAREVTDALTIIVSFSDSILAISGSQPGQLTGSFGIKVNSHSAAVALAAEIDGNFADLSRSADRLIEAAESGDDISVTNYVIAIRVKAKENIMILLNQQEIYSISYNDRTNTRTATSKHNVDICIGVHIGNVCLDLHIRF